MSFFHNLNKTLDSIAARPESAPLNERDMSRAAKGYEKYGEPGMNALRDGGLRGDSEKEMDAIRAKYDRYDNKEVDEGLVDVVKKVGGMAKKAGGAVLNKVGHGDDVDMIRDLQRKMDMPQTGKKPEQKTDEAAKYRDPKYKDKLYTQEPPDYTYGPDMDDAYYNPKPDDYAGRKRKIGGSEFDHNDPLRKGDGIGRSGIKNNILDRGPRKGLPSRDQITSLKGSIKSAKGTHAEPNLPEAGLPMVKGPDGKMVPKFAFDGSGPGDLKKSFADKIDSAKQEVEEMLGDVAAEAMRNALGGRQQVADEGNEFVNSRLDAIKAGKPSFKVGNKSYRVTGDTSDEKSMVQDDKEDLNPFTNYKKPRRDAPKRGEVTHGRHHDIKHDTTDQRYSGMIATRRSDAQGNSVGSETDAEGNTIDKRGRGRPKGPEKGPERTTAKAYKHKGGRKMTKEGGEMIKHTFAILDDTLIDQIAAMNGAEVDPDASSVETYDENTARQLIAFAQKNPQRLKRTHTMNTAGMRPMARRVGGTATGPEYGLKEEGGDLKAAMTLLKKAGYKVSKAVEEESTTKRDTHAERAGKKVAKDIEYDEKKKDGIHGKKRGAEDDKAEKAGKKVAKDIEYDDKKDEVKEDEPKKSNNKFKFGGSVYETLDAQLETLITEGMSVTVNMSQNSDDGHPGTKSITVNADGEDAERLAELLQMAGLSQQSGSCSSCGSSPCGCNMVDENDPNWPSNTETSDNALQYSGGLNGPKSTGQSTTPVLASQLRRQVSMEQSAKVEQNLLNLYRTFGK